MSSLRTTPVSFLKHAADVANFYGFRPIRDIEREQLRAAGIKPVSKRMQGAYSFESAALVCAAQAALRPQDPVLAYYATPNPSHVPAGLCEDATGLLGEFGLQVVGTSESIGEIVLLKLLVMIASEWGVPLTRVRVNALGDRDSQLRFLRDLSAHVRKHADRLEELERKAALTDPYCLYRMHSDIARDILENGPRPVNFLSEKSRAHFRSVLEHLENLGFPYELDYLLAGDDRGPHIAFALDFDNADATLTAAYGGRFDEYLKRESHRKDSTGVGASVFFRKKGATKTNFTAVAQPQKPRIYFAQLGLRAKLQGLEVLDMLRTAQIPVQQSFDANHLSLQLASAAQVGVSHLLIMGQREALDGTIIVRSMRNSSQNIIPLREMPRFLRTLR